MYLVINLTVADMFFGGMGTFDIVFHFLLYGCEVGNELFPIVSIIANQEWEPFIVLAMISMLLSLTSVAGIAENSYFFRSDACDVLSIHASQHQKMGLRSNNCGCLDLGIVLLIDPVLIIAGDKRSPQS